MDSRLEVRSCEERGDAFRLLAGKVEPRRPRPSRRRPDDAAVDKKRLELRDRPGGIGRDRVRVDVDAREAARRPGDLDGGVRRTDREQDLAAAADLGDVPGVLEPSRLRALGGCRTPAGGRPEHGLATLAQRARDHRSNLAGMQDTDDGHAPSIPNAFAAILRSPL